ncbi:MAG: hypothetical protein IKU45_01185 [Clostridia bacterium]|nr:hypothetical protein [Clostridia bacterium]
MKKLIALVLTGLMIVALVACGAKAPKLEGVEAPVDILKAVWETYDSETEMFFAMGGDMNNMVDNAPGAYSLEDKESAAAQLVLNEKAIAMVDGAASLMHAMNANNFTGAAYHIAEGSTAADFIAEMKEAIKNNQWICGFPEKLLVAELTDEYVVIAFGAGDIIDTFNNKLVAKFDMAKVTVDPIA